MTASRKPKKVPVVRVAVGVAALGLVGAGAAMIYPPAGLIAVGLLVWIDISR